MSPLMQNEPGVNPLTPLQTLFDTDQGCDFPLPEELARVYGRLQLPTYPARPYVMGNFVTTLDGVVSLNVPVQAGGGEISGSNAHDRMVMGLLRAVADVVIVGAGTLRANPQHLWTADYIYPPLVNEYQRLRTDHGKPPAPLNVIVTASGHLDLSLPVFQTGEVPTLIVTTPHGAQRLDTESIPPSVQVVAGHGGRTLSARAIMAAVAALDHAGSGDVILVEGGPHLIGDFFAEQCLHELFLTLAPQIAGRDGTTERPGLVSGKTFAPEQPLWGTLTGLKRGESHLFLRYAFATGNPGPLST